MPKPVIEGIKLIKHNMGGVNNPDEPEYGPFRLDALFRVPSFMEVAAAFIYGREEIVVRGKTREALEQFVKVNSLDTHPRKIKVEITEPEAAGKEPEIKPHAVTLVTTRASSPRSREPGQAVPSPTSDRR